MIIHRTLEPQWPDYPAGDGRQTFCQLQTIEDIGLRALKCQGWELVQNPEFNFLTLRLKPNTGRTAERWFERFCDLGQDQDVIVKTQRYDVLLHRPICTDLNKYKICFHYLVGPPETVYSRGEPCT